MPRVLLENRLATLWPPEAWQDVTVLAAVSGGADSVGMIRALAALKMGGRGRLIVAHFNHGLRPDAGDDGRFVADLAVRLGLACELGEGKVAATADEQGDGLEAAARSARYAFLQATAERLGARYLVTAHTADDQAETVLHRILRGTAIGGLAGIKHARPLGPAVTLLRPLLALRRAEIRAYLKELNQSFREDSTNADRGFTRNRIRHDLLPRLASEYNPNVVEAIVRLGQTADAAQRIIHSRVEELLERCIIQPESPAARFAIDCRLLAGEPRHLLRELFVSIWQRHAWPQQAMGFAEWDALAEMAQSAAAPQPQRIFPGQIAAQKTGEQLSLARLS